MVEAYGRFDSNAVDKLRDLLKVLKICLDYSSDKVELLLERMNLSSKRPEDREGWNVDENTFETLCSEAENNLPPLLEQRAAMVAAHVGYFISRYASTLGNHADERLLQWREGVGPHALADFAHGLDRDDFLNLLIADRCYRVWPGYDPVDVLRVPSYGEIQPVVGVLEMEEFPLLPVGYTPSFDFGYFMDCVRDGAMWRHPEYKGAQYGRPELRTAPPTTGPGVRNSDARRLAQRLCRSLPGERYSRLPRGRRVQSLAFSRRVPKGATDSGEDAGGARYRLSPSRRVLRIVRQRASEGAYGPEKGHRVSKSRGSPGLPGFRVGEADPQRLAWPEPPWRRYL